MLFPDRLLLPPALPLSPFYSFQVTDHLNVTPQQLPRVRCYVTLKCYLWPVPCFDAGEGDT